MNLDELLNMVHRNTFMTNVGRIVSYNTGTQTCTVQVVKSPSVKNADGTYSPAPYPPMRDVPVMFPAGGGANFTFGLEPGDTVLVMARQLSHDELDAGDLAEDVPESRSLAQLKDVVVLAAFSLPGSLSPRQDGQPQIDLPTASALHVGQNATYTVVRTDILTGHLNALKTWVDNHVHMAAGSPTSGPVSLPVPLPDPLPDPFEPPPSTSPNVPNLETPRIKVDK